jgi:hypothetical protein
LNSWGLIALGIFFLADRNLVKKIKKPIRYSSLIPFVGIFFLYLIAYIFSEKDHDAFHTMFTKMSFLLFPVFLIYESYLSKETEKKLILIFSFALCLGFLYEIGYSIYINYILTDDLNWYKIFNRMSLSKGIMHPGYYSNYFMLAIVWQYFNPNRFRNFFILFFTIVLLLLISRIVILFYLIFILYVTVSFVLKSKKPILTGVFMLVIFITACFGLYQTKTIKYRVDETIRGINNTQANVGYSAATASRRIAYSVEIKLIMEKPVLGYGLGNANEILQSRLVESGYNKLSKRMHTHSHYLNAWLQIGVLGFGWIVFLLGYLAVEFRKTKNHVGLWFTLLVALNLMTDDMLEIQAGVVFFTLIWSLFYFTQKGVKPQ